MINFLDLAVNYENSKVSILPVPFEGTVSYKKGTSKGPESILKASFELETFDYESKREPYLVGIHTMKSLSKKSQLQLLKEISKTTEKPIKDNKFLITLGGEHSITQAVIPNLLDKYPNISVLQIDAHADLKNKFDNNKYSHACVMRRVHELCKNITQIGIRSVDKSEYIYSKKNNLSTFYMEDMRKSKSWLKEVVNSLNENVYITLDVDSLDPSIMPSTGTPEPGGLYYYEILNLLREVFKNKNVVAMDVVELSPNKDNPAPDFTIAKLIYKSISFKFNE